MGIGRICFVLLALLTSAGVLAKEAWLAWQVVGQEVQVRHLEGAANLPSSVPLGSTWKLFVFAYLHGTSANEPLYRCDSAASIRKKGDEYCCEAGESVGRQAALARSCGTYFEPARLGIAAADWERFWKLHDSPKWLHSLSNLRSAMSLEVPELLQGLKSISGGTRYAARLALAPVSLNLGAGEVLAAWGSGPRFKTFSWDHPQLNGASLGGAAGWLADGTPFWLAGQGSSRDSLRRLVPLTLRHLPRSENVSTEGPCVRVDFLTRYPVKEIVDAETHNVVRSGLLTRRHLIRLANDRLLSMNATPASGEILVEAQAAPNGRAQSQGTVRLSGRFTLNEYVARVIDREADAQRTEAAQALAVVARTYLLQNASFEQGCFRIADDSRTQRVSLNPASGNARAAALATDDLILHGTTVHYHRDRAAPGVMSWHAAVQQNNQGRKFTAILRDNWPNAHLSVLDASSECRPLLAAHQWLATASSAWRRQLAKVPGFEMPTRFDVCELAFGHPYADVRRARIYTRHWQTREGRITLAHEFMHLAFAHHPLGSDEQFAERWARQLADTTTLNDFSREPK